MDLKDIFPLEFNHKFDDYKALIRSIFMKSLYDSRVKTLSKYKGMHKSNYFNECWTLKFGYEEGVYGFILSEVKNRQAVFELYYFPTLKDKFLDKISLFEAVVVSKDGYLTKVRNFSNHKELFLNFKIAKIYMLVQEKGISVSLKSRLKDRLYAKDGVCIEGKTIVEKGGLDRNLPSFRLSLPFLNFIHIALSQIYKPNFNTLKIYKRSVFEKIYNNIGHIQTKKDIFASEIYINVLYGDGEINRNFTKPDFKEFHINSPLFRFLRNLEKNSERNMLKEQKERANFFVVTGYLGSGKTKFLQNFIEYETAQNRFTAIIQNEIGKIGLDGELLDAKYASVEIDEGCVCCSMSGQIKVACAALNAKKPDTILLETTGVANPFNLLSELNDIKDLINFCSIITVVDGANFLSEYKKSQILLEQIKAADIILLNKIDLISQAEKDKIRRILVQNNKCAEIFETINSRLNPNFLFYNHSQTSYMASVVIEGKMHATHSNEGIISFKKEINDKIIKENFLNYIKNIPKEFFRIKGLMSFENDPGQYVFQFVNGKFDITLFDKQKRCDNFLIFIGRNIDENFYFPKEFLQISKFN